MSKLIITFFLISFIRFVLLIITKKSTTIFTAISSSTVSFLATCAYLLPINENLNYYQGALVNMPLLQFLITQKDDVGEIALDPDPDILSDLIKNVSQYGSFFIFFAVYFIVIRYGKKYKIDYFIRYNVMHSILIMLLQVPITYFYVELVQFLTLNQFLKAFTMNLATSLILVNFFIIFYAIYYSLTNRYVQLPIITDACELHVGKNEQ